MDNCGSVPAGPALCGRPRETESSHAWLGIDSASGDTTWGKNQDLTEDALYVLQTTFDNIRANKGFVVVRICYDPWYNGRSNVTPDHEWVLKHVKQLAPVLSKNTDVIVALEMGMHGAYGEMHSDTNIHARVITRRRYWALTTGESTSILTARSLPKLRRRRAIPCTA